MTHQELTEIAQDLEQTVILFDGLEPALIGYVTDPMRAVYDYDECVECFIKTGMTREEALEWMTYNTERTCDNLGKSAPVLVHTGGTNENTSNS